MPVGKSILTLIYRREMGEKSLRFFENDFSLVEASCFVEKIDNFPGFEVRPGPLAGGEARFCPSEGDLAIHPIPEIDPVAHILGGGENDFIEGDIAGIDIDRPLGLKFSGRGEFSLELVGPDLDLRKIVRMDQFRKGKAA